MKERGLFISPCCASVCARSRPPSLFSSVSLPPSFPPMIDRPREGSPLQRHGEACIKDERRLLCFPGGRGERRSRGVTLPTHGADVGQRRVGKGRGGTGAGQMQTGTPRAQPAARVPTPSPLGSEQVSGDSCLSQLIGRSWRWSESTSLIVSDSSVSSPPSSTNWAILCRQD